MFNDAFKVNEISNYAGILGGFKLLLEVKNVKKIYGKGLHKTTALNGMTFNVQQGEFVAIMGESGSGKTTLLNVIATFDKINEGSIRIDNRQLNHIRHKEVAHFRRETLGFVFQDFNMLPTMSNKDNIIMPLVLANRSHKTIDARLAPLSQQLGIEHILDQFPYQSSGGEQQRVGIARALINQPKLLLADEPTGALDSKTSKQIMRLLQKINQRQQTILMVTHSNIDASYANRVLFIKDGRVYHEIYRGEETQSDFQRRIADSLAMLNERGE